MALAITDPSLSTVKRLHRPATRHRARGHPGRCRASRRRRCLAHLAVVALGSSGFVAATEVVAAVGRVVIEAPAPAPADDGGWNTRPVAAGDSLWSIAESLAPGADVRPLVDELVRLNGGTAVSAGELVRVPQTRVEDGR